MRLFLDYLINRYVVVDLDGWDAPVKSNTAARNPDPSFMMVLVGKSDYCYCTDDGISVVPVTDLAP